MAMLRAFVKTAAAEAARRTGTDRMLAALAAAPVDEPLVLGYHRVVENCAPSAARSIPAMLISTRMLERQLDWVGRRFRFVSLDELGDFLESGARTDRPVAAVTFDDGYCDVYEHAFPLLKRKGIPFAVFVVTDLMGSARGFSHDRLYLLLARVLSDPARGPAGLARLIRDVGVRVEGLGNAARRRANGALAATRALIEALPSSSLETLMEALAAEVGLEEEEADLAELAPLKWEMVAQMHRAGVTIGAHSRSHALLTREDGERIREEVAGSRQSLESRLGAPVRHFAYPDGRFNATVVDEVAAAGYRLAFTTCRHRDLRRPLLTVTRRLLWENSCRNAVGRFSSAVMHCHVLGMFDLLSRCRQDHGRPERSSARSRPA